MIERRGSFEAVVKRRVREQVNADPAMLAEYRRRHRWWWVLCALKMVFYPWLFVTAVTFFPCVVLASLSLTVANLVLANSDAGEFMHVTDDWAFAILAMIGAAVVTASAMTPWRSFLFERHARVFAFLPVSDRDLFRRTSPVWCVFVAYSLYLISIPYAVIAWHHGLALSQMVLLSLLAAWQAWHVMALVIVSAQFFYPSKSGELGRPTLGVIFYLATFIPLFVDGIPATYQHAACLLVFVLPTGWLPGTIYYAVFRGEAAGWLFLVPAIATSAYAAWWLWRGYAIREFQFTSLGEPRPVFEYGFPNAPSSRDQLADAPPVSEESETAVIKRLLAHESLAAAPNWKDGWWIERWIGRRLSERERFLMEWQSGGRPRWTLSSLLGEILLLTLLTVGVGFFGVTLGSDQSLALMRFFLFVIVFSDFLALVPSDGRSFTRTLRGTPPFHPVFPIGVREVTSLTRKLVPFRFLAWIPVVIVAAILEHYWGVDSLAGTAFSLLLCIALITISSPLLVRIMFSQTAQFRWHWRRVVVTGMLAVTIGMGIAVLAIPRASIACAMLLLLATGAWLTCWLFDCHYHRKELDFSTPNPLAPRNQKQRPWL